MVGVVRRVERFLDFLVLVLLVCFIFFGFILVVFFCGRFFSVYVEGVFGVRLFVVLVNGFVFFLFVVAFLDVFYVGV